MHGRALPRVDARNRQEVQRRPWIHFDATVDGGLARGAHDQQDSLAATDGSAEEDEPSATS